MGMGGVDMLFEALFWGLSSVLILIFPDFLAFFHYG